MFEILLSHLEQSRQEFLQCCVENEDHRAQHHPDLSPTGWHLGHCIFTENYWVREVLLGSTCCEEEKSLYVPDYSAKADRGAALPEQEDLLEWATQSYRENSELLRQLRSRQHDLLEGNYLLHFLIQHYAQHLETIKLAQQQAALRQVKGTEGTDSLQSRTLNREAVTMPASHYAVGQTTRHRPYDNESPAHDVMLEAFSIGKRPVSNAEYLRFMEDDGYTRKHHWTVAGWQWLQNFPVRCPEYWHNTANSNWHVITPAGVRALPADAPVYGINRHEAAAFANWAGARLPHEHEWEAAYKAGLLEDTGRVWEWCGNTFYPYEGFTAFPYEGYSVPYFDAHYTLKGGSCLTRPVIKRPSFRNYYEASKRFMFAGLRLVFN